MCSFYSFLIFILWLQPPLCHFKQPDRRSEEVIIYEENEQEPNGRKKKQNELKKAVERMKKDQQHFARSKASFSFLAYIFDDGLLISRRCEKESHYFAVFKLILSFKRCESNERIIVLLKIRVWTYRSTSTSTSAPKIQRSSLELV